MEEISENLCNSVYIYIYIYNIGGWEDFQKVRGWPPDFFSSHFLDKQTQQYIK